MSTRLRRRVGTFDAVVLGLGAMMGAGVFVAIAPATAAAGAASLVALAAAAVVAYCNARSSARLAARYPESGGTYVYGRERLGPFWGYIAGWSFVTGKTASCAAMALTLGAYVFPHGARIVAVGAALVLTAVNVRGIHKTVWATRLILVVVIAALAASVIASLGGGSADVSRLVPQQLSVTGVLRGGGFLFFSFAGYARLATLGEEVVDPHRTIPKAIAVSLGIVIAVYALVAASALAAAGPRTIAASDAPLVASAEAGRLSALGPAIRAGAGVAALGVMLSLLAGMGRTVLAMARRRDLPQQLDAVHARFGVPHRAEIVAGLAVALLAATWDVRGAIGFSSVLVLLYYAIANASAWTLGGAATRTVAGVGVAGCAALAIFLPARTLLVAAAVLAAGVAAYALTVRRRRSSAG